jgi:aspartate-semialdehyde dehydrogenase
VVGATGLVGRELISILVERGVEPSAITAVASDASASSMVELGGCAFVLQPLRETLFVQGCVVFMCVSAEVSKQWSPRAVAVGCTVVDCSSAFRRTDGVPLVIPCVNGHLLDEQPSLIACPNCTTIVLLTAISPLRKAFSPRLRSVTVATYQAVSGAGRDGLDALASETAGHVPVVGGVFPEPCAGNVFCHESPVDVVSGLSGEEEKVIAETHRIWADDLVAIVPTCMRVPVERVHTEAITLEFSGGVSEADVLRVLRASPEVVLMDGPGAGGYPTALKASGGDEVLVGHVRVQHGRGFTRVSLVACGDQLRTGAALNAARIALFIRR